MAVISRPRLRLVLAVGTLALVALHLWIARDVTLPRRGPGDQWGYWGSARFVAGDPRTYLLPYFPHFSYGYPIVLAPVVWMFDDPSALFRSVKVVNALLAAAVFPLLYAFGRCVLDASRPHALAGAAMGALVPPLVLHPSAILAENLVLPLAIATILACWLFLTERPSWQRLLFAPAMVWLHVSHNRFALSWPFFFLLLLVAARSRLTPARLALINGGVAVALLLAGQVLRNNIVAARWTQGVETPPGPAGDGVEVLYQRKLFQEFLLEAVGHVWYLVVGTLGLAAIGVWAVTRRLVTRPAAANAESTCSRWTAAVHEPRRLTLAFLLAIGASVFITSTYFFTRVVNGAEGFVAGRHNDSFVPMWVAAGTVLIVSTTPTRRLRPVLLVVAAVGLVSTAVLLAGRSGYELGGYYSTLNAPAIAHWGAVGEEVVHAAAAVAIGALLVAALVAHFDRWPVVLLPLACAWLVWSNAVEVSPDSRVEELAVPMQLERLGVQRAAVVQTRFGGMPVYYQYLLPSLTAAAWDGDGAPPEPYVFAELPSELTERGGRVAMIDEPISVGLRPAYAVALWVMPGAEQDRLATAGRLLPPGFPAALPASATVADLEAPEGTTIPVAPGEAVRVRLRGRHAGSGSPWPDEGSAGVDGTVRVAAHPVAGASGPAPARRYAELPAWLWPGDPFDVVLTLRAVDEQGRPLPAGRYRVAVDLEQRGFGPFSAPGEEPLELVLDVR